MASGRIPNRGVVLAPLLLAPLVLVSSEKLTTEQMLTRHRSQGMSGTRLPDGHVRELRGTVTMVTPLQAAVALEGTFGFTSAAGSSRVVLQFGTRQYEGESWSTDRGNVEIGFAQPRTSSRSALGIFLWMNSVIVREGLLGGVLNARWPLLDVGGRRASVSYEGLTKRDGRELHRLRYRAKQGQGPLEVLVFLDPVRYQHVATVYSLSQQQGIVTGAEDSSDREIVFRLEERFSDFVRFGARALPKTWTLFYERSERPRQWKYEIRTETLDEHALKAARSAPPAWLRSPRGREARSNPARTACQAARVASGFSGRRVSDEFRATALHAVGTGFPADRSRHGRAAKRP